jgi:SAM-dependent methyltransferase
MDDLTMAETPPDVIAYNRDAWDREVSRGNRWTVPVTSEQIAAARGGEWEVVLTPTRAVPRAWFGDLAGSRVLALASGGGQQVPILAAAGAHVTVLDNSPLQLERDREVAKRDGLAIRTELGQMHDLSRFGDGNFDLIFHPTSNSFAPEVRTVWRECFRVLRIGGRLLSGFANPVLYLFDEEADTRGELVVRHRIPYADTTSLDAEALATRLESGEPLQYGHTLDDQIGGQIDAGFRIEGFFEDGFPATTLDRYLPTFIATLAVKPG